MNHVDIVGRLTKDPELKQTTSGTSFCSFTVAVNRVKSQGDHPEADFIPCQAWNKTAENLCKFMKKGSLVGVEGRINISSYTNQQGEKRSITQVVASAVHFIGPWASNERSNPQNQPAGETAQMQEKPANSNDSSVYEAYGIANDDLPF